MNILYYLIISILTILVLYILINGQFIITIIPTHNNYPSIPYPPDERSGFYLYYIYIFYILSFSIIRLSISS